MVHCSSTPFTNTPFGYLAIKSRRGDLETLTLDKQIIQTTRGDCLKSAITGFEHQNRTQLEKISHGSYFQNFWPDGKLIGARRRSKLALLFVLVKVLFSAAA